MRRGLTVYNLEFQQALEDYKVAQNYFKEATDEKIDEAILYLNACEARVVRIIKEQRLKK